MLLLTSCIDQAPQDALSNVINKSDHQIVIDTTKTNFYAFSSNQVILGMIFFSKNVSHQNNTKNEQMISIIKKNQAKYRARIWNEVLLTKGVMNDRVLLPRYIKKICIYIKTQNKVHRMQFFDIVPRGTSQIYIQIADNQIFMSSK